MVTETGHVQHKLAVSYIQGLICLVRSSWVARETSGTCDEHNDELLVVPRIPLCHIIGLQPSPTHRVLDVFPSAASSTPGTGSQMCLLAWGHICQGE